MKRKRRKKPERLLELALVLLFLLVVISMVGPARQLMVQRRSISDKQSSLDNATARTGYYKNEVKKLEDPEYISVLAREQFGLVKPGEDSYIIAGAPKDTLPNTIVAKPRKKPANWWEKFNGKWSDFFGQ